MEYYLSIHHWYAANIIPSGEYKVRLSQISFQQGTSSLAAIASLKGMILSIAAAASAFTPGPFSNWVIMYGYGPDCRQNLHIRSLSARIRLLTYPGTTDLRRITGLAPACAVTCIRCSRQYNCAADDSEGKMGQ